MNKQKLLLLQRKKEKHTEIKKFAKYVKEHLVLIDAKYFKAKDHCYYTGRYLGAAHVVCSKKCKTSKEIHVVFHNGSTYDYHFIIKELAQEFKGKFECLGENTEKYITFSVPIEKEGVDGKPMVYKIKFIDSFRFVSTSLSSLIDSLSDGLYNITCKEYNF